MYIHMHACMHACMRAVRRTHGHTRHIYRLRADKQVNTHEGAHGQAQKEPHQKEGRKLIWSFQTDLPTPS